MISLQEFGERVEELELELIYKSLIYIRMFMNVYSWVQTFLNILLLREKKMCKKVVTRTFDGFSSI